jgi:hypothetical protein
MMIVNMFIVQATDALDSLQILDKIGGSWNQPKMIAKWMGWI